MSPGSSELNTRIYTPFHENLYSPWPKGLSEYNLSCWGQSKFFYSPQTVLVTFQYS